VRLKTVSTAGSRSAQEQVGWQAAFASRLALTEKQKQKQTPPLFITQYNERKLE